MSQPTEQAIRERYQAAIRALEGGSALRAKRQVEELIRLAPDPAPAHNLLGKCLAALNDPAGAEKAFRQSVAVGERQPAAHAGFADFLVAQGRLEEAMASYRAALAIDPAFAPAVMGLCRLLAQAGLVDEAARVMSPAAERPDAPAMLLDAYAVTLDKAGRNEEALAASRRAKAGGSRYGAATTAKLLSDLGRHAEAEAEWRALLREIPGDLAVHQGLARAIWEASSDTDAALAPLDEAMRTHWSPALVMLKAKLLNRAARSGEAYELLEESIARRANNAGLHAAAATAAAHARKSDASYQHAERALQLAPQAVGLKVLVAETSLGAGRPERAAALIEPLRRAAPLDQKYISLAAQAWRLLGDPRYGQIYDFDRVIRAYTIEPPEGWSTLAAFMSDLRTHLNTIHDTLSEPLEQSVRHGTQTSINLAYTEDPMIKALMAALGERISEHIARMQVSRDPLADPLGARHNGRFAYSGAWSVRLRPGGHHINHIHPDGWLSSAFYVDLPPVVQDGDDSHAGWIKFGEFDVPADPPLTAERYVKPEPGRLVLFPSYMLHGTVPFGGHERRTTFAFDLVPGR